MFHKANISACLHQSLGLYLTSDHLQDTNFDEILSMQSLPIPPEGNESHFGKKEPVVSDNTGWRERIHFIENWVSPKMDREVLILFRRFFVLKTWIFTFIKIGDWSRMFHDLESFSSAAIVTIGSILAWRRDRYRLGATIMLGFWCYKELYLYFPRTANHNFFEILVFLCFVLFDDKALPQDPSSSIGPGSQRKEMADGSGARVVQVAIVASVFYSGLQKAFHGYWLNGEIVAHLSLFEVDLQFLWIWHPFLDFMSKFFPQSIGTIPYEWPNIFGVYPLNIPGWARNTFVIGGWLAVLGEIFFPLLILFKRTRTLGFILVTATISVFSAMAGIFGFTFTGVSSCLLFFPEQAKRNFKLFFTILILFYIVMILSDYFFKIPYTWK